MMRIAGLLRTVVAMTLLGGVLAACDKDKDVEPPKALVAFKAQVAVERVWTASLGGKDHRLRLALVPALDEGHLYAAGGEGQVGAYDAVSGRSLWHVVSKLPLSAGPGAGAGLVVLGTLDGRVLALDAATGARRWLIRTSGEVLAPPTVTASGILLRTVDGHLHNLALADGREVWSNEQPVPALTLRGTAPPTVVGDAVIAAFDNGKVSAYALTNGDILWDTAVSPSRGKTELERLVDIDGPVVAEGHDLFVVGFQGRVAQLGLDTGQIWWSRDSSSYRGLTLAGDSLFVTSADSKILALSRRDGTERWTQDALARRGLTRPVVDGDSIVVVDFEGFVHWLDRSTGTLVGRIGTARKARVTNAPIAGNGLVYVQNDAGQVFALRGRPRS
ncbi:MAG: outer membrane protein assembly factor BamB [Pseudomonadota bacterium]